MFSVQIQVRGQEPYMWVQAQACTWVPESESAVGCTQEPECKYLKQEEQ
jgi:hypothetical protein